MGLDCVFHVRADCQTRGYVYMLIESGLQCDRLFLVGVILVLLPRVIVFASQTSDQSRVQLTPLEGFLALHFGIWLVAISLALVLNVSLIPYLIAHDVSTSF